jgi:hypothetical protein
VVAVATIEAVVIATAIAEIAITFFIITFYAG